MKTTSATIVRTEIRAGRFAGPTSGLAPGFVQANIAIVPERFAADFAQFCARNNRACALLHQSAPGEFLLPALGENIDIRSDVPRYLVHEKGVPSEEVTDIRDLWRDDLVTFALGCSFSFEEPLVSAGLEVRNISEGCNVPMYRTNRECQPSGPFRAKLVVSMRPFSPDRVGDACAISGRYPLVHGAPIQIGAAEQLGIGAIGRPDFGDAVSVHESEYPTFWACGVTAIEALRNAELDFCITHAPGHMLITDRLNQSLDSVTDVKQLNWGSAYHTTETV